MVQDYFHSRSAKKNAMDKFGDKNDVDEFLRRENLEKKRVERLRKKKIAELHARGLDPNNLPPDELHHSILSSDKQSKNQSAEGQSPKKRGRPRLDQSLANGSTNQTVKAKEEKKPKDPEKDQPKEKSAAKKSKAEHKEKKPTDHEKDRPKEKSKDKESSNEHKGKKTIAKKPRDECKEKKSNDEHKQKKPKELKEKKESHQQKDHKEKKENFSQKSDINNNNNNNTDQNTKPLKKTKLESQPANRPRKADTQFQHEEAPLSLSGQRWRHSTSKLKQDPEDVSVCQCSEDTDIIPCGEKCMNRLLMIECTPGYCPMGARCTNMNFQNKNYSKVVRINCGQRGYGLKILEDVPANHFIIEYAGEIIDSEESQRRLMEDDQHHFYILTLNSTWHVDARYKGNMSRYINHSCAPNCETRKWFVQGELRCGIFSLRPLEAGTELTFDYQFDTQGVSRGQKCYCGEKTCRGYLGVKVTEEILEQRRQHQEETVQQQTYHEQLISQHLFQAQQAPHEAYLLSLKESAEIVPLSVIQPACYFKPETEKFCLFADRLRKPQEERKKGKRGRKRLSTERKNSSNQSKTTPETEMQVVVQNNNVNTSSDNTNNINDTIQNDNNKNTPNNSLSNNNIISHEKHINKVESVIEQREVMHHEAYLSFALRRNIRSTKALYLSFLRRHTWNPADKERSEMPLVLGKPFKPSVKEKKSAKKDSNKNKPPKTTKKN